MVLVVEPDVERDAAPEAYDSLRSHDSYTRVLFQFLFDPEISLFSRQVRPRPGQVQVDDETNHDVQLIEASPELTSPPAAPATTY